MANKSNWKGFEADVATVLGGHRRRRTMESFDLKVPDVYFPKKLRKRYPALQQIAVECKKRNLINVHALFAEATAKYGAGGKNTVVFASKIPRRGLTEALDDFRAKVCKRYSLNSPIWKRMMAKCKKKCKRAGKKVRRKDVKRIERALERRLKSTIKMGEAKIRAKKNITSLVTVEIGFFEKLWWAWLRETTGYGSKVHGRRAE